MNRLKEKHSFQQGTNSLQETSDFAEYLSYDANGNILTAYRNASLTSAGGQVMDNLNYQYLNNTNKLDYVTDQVSITSINWSVYGKIRGMIKCNTTTGKETTTQYGYDPSGNRTYKEVIRRDIGNYSQDIKDYTY